MSVLSFISQSVSDAVKGVEAAFAPKAPAEPAAAPAPAPSVQSVPMTKAPVAPVIAPQAAPFAAAKASMAESPSSALDFISKTPVTPVFSAKPKSIADTLTPSPEVGAKFNALIDQTKALAPSLASKVVLPALAGSSQIAEGGKGALNAAFHLLDGVMGLPGEVTSRLLGQPVTEGFTNQVGSATSESFKAAGASDKTAEGAGSAAGFFAGLLEPLGGDFESLLSKTAAEKIAESSDPMEISRIFQKEVPNIKPETADVLGQVFKNVHDPEDVQQGLQLIHFKAGGGKDVQVKGKDSAYPVAPDVNQAPISPMDFIRGNPVEDAVNGKSNAAESPIKSGDVISSKPIQDIEIIDGKPTENGKSGYGWSKIESDHPDVVPFIKEALQNAKVVETLPQRKILEGSTSDGRRIRLIVDEQLFDQPKTFLNNAYFVSGEGLEPTTSRASNESSTIELSRHGSSDTLPSSNTSVKEFIAKPISEAVAPKSESSSIPKDLQPLADEARKYGSAEDFVKTQGESLYHGTQNGSVENINKVGIIDTGRGGISLTSDKNIAAGYASKNGKILNVILSPSTKLINGDKFEDIVDKIIKTTKNDYVTKEEQLRVDTLAAKEAKSLGYDGVDYRNSDVVSLNKGEVRIWNTDKIKTKSQLTDFYNKATGKTAGKISTFAGRTAGPRADIDTIRKLIAEIIPKNELRLVFSKDLIDGNMEGVYRGGKSSLGIKGALKPMIELHEHNGMVSVRTAYYESFHYVFDNFFAQAEKDAALAKAKKEMSGIDNFLYEARGYDRGEDQRAEEYLADEYARQKARDAGFSGPLEKFFAKLNEIMTRIVEGVKKVLKKIDDMHPKEGRQGGYVKNPLHEDMSPEDEIGQMQQELELRQEALDNHPAAKLGKYAHGRGEFAGELPEVGSKGTSRFAKDGDSIVTEHGFKDSEEARDAYQDFKDKKAELDEAKRQYLTRKLELTKQKQAEMTESDRAKYSKDLVRNPDGQEVTIERKQLATANLRNMLKKTYEIKAPANIEYPAAGLDAIAASQPVTEQEFNEMNSEDPFRKLGSGPGDIDLTTPLKQRIGVHDMFRTPDRVLRKIGLGENMKFIRHSYESYLAELPGHLDLITTWKDVYKKASFGGKEEENNTQLFRYLDGKPVTLTPKEKEIADEIRDYLKEWAYRLGLPEDNQVSHYITHLFGVGENEKEFDEELAKIISDKVPGSVYDPFLLKRLGKKGYLEDPWKALEAYVKRGTRKANMDPALEGLKAAANRLEESQLKYVKEFADRINLRPTDIDTKIDNTVKQVIGHRLGQRPTANVTRKMRALTYRAFIGLNFGSAVKNLTQGVNTYALLGEKYTTIGYIKMMSNWNNEEMYNAGIFGQDFIQDKTLSAVHKGLEKFDKGLFYAFETAEKINRSSAYWGAKQKGLDLGLDEGRAIEYAKKIVRDTQFQFGSIDTPLAFSSDIMKTFFQLGTYGFKQAEFVAEMGGEKNWLGILRYIAAAMLITYVFGKILNISWTYFVPLASNFTGQTPFGQPPSLGLPASIIGALLNSPDHFGKTRDASQKLWDISAAVPYPGMVQAQKTFRGVQQYLNPKNKIPHNAFELGKAAMLGSQNLKPEQSDSVAAYFAAQKSATSALSASEKAFKPTFDAIRAKMGEGDTAGATADYNALSEADKKTYGKMKKSAETTSQNDAEKEIYSTVVQGRQLVGDEKTAEAKALYDGLDASQKKAYDTVKRKFFPNNSTVSSIESAPAPKVATSTPISKSGVIDTIVTYAKALGTDPITAFDRIFTGQRIKEVDNGTIIVDRMSFDDSQAMKKSRGGNNPTMKLDHIVPLEAGGDNSADNLQLIPTAQWSQNTPVENFLAKQLTAGNITGKQAREYAIRFKAGSGEKLSDSVMKEYKDKYGSAPMTAQEVYDSVTP